MILQYDDIVQQVVARLQAVIPQTPVKVAKIVVMENFQKQLGDFLNSAEQSKILVTYSGSTAEGGRALDDFTKTLKGNTQQISHTIEAHICTKRYMTETLSDTPNTMLRLMWTVTAALNGLKMFQRLVGVVQYGKDEYALTEGMIYLETLIDRSFEGMIVAVVRFQIMEMIPEAEELNAEQIWGTYQEITIQEYSNEDGEEEDDSGNPTTTVVVT